MSRSTTTNRPLEQVPPGASQTEPTLLDFDSEADLLALLDRMRRDLHDRVSVAIENAQSNDTKGKGKSSQQGQVDRTKVDEIVQQKFFDHVAQTVLKNCSIAGEPYKIDRKTKQVVLKGNTVETQPLDQKLDSNVRKYQEQLFEAREVNAKERINAPQRVAEEVKKLVALDSEHFENLEKNKVELPHTEQSLRADKKVTEKDGITSQQAQEYFSVATEGLKQILADVPNLDYATEQATRTAVDTSKSQ
ncbi:hypothetical protein JCM16303_004779 [Sporobolomyces ruberrimus]